jgi:hypothetical protein
MLRNILRTVTPEQVDPDLSSYVIEQVLDTHRLEEGAENYVRQKLKPRIEQRLHQSRAAPKTGRWGSVLIGPVTTSAPATTPASRPAESTATGANPSNDNP